MITLRQRRDRDRRGELLRAYGYDVRGEVFGSAGMVTAGDPRSTNGALDATGMPSRHRRGDEELLRRRLHRRSSPSSADWSAQRSRARHRRGRAARRSASPWPRLHRSAGAAGDIDRVGGPVPGRSRRARRRTDRLHPRRLRRDGVHRPALRWSGSGGIDGWVSRSRSGTGPTKDIDALGSPGATSSPR